MKRIAAAATAVALLASAFVTVQAQAVTWRDEWGVTHDDHVGAGIPPAECNGDGTYSVTMGASMGGLPGQYPDQTIVFVYGDTRVEQVLQPGGSTPIMPFTGVSNGVQVRLAIENGDGRVYDEDFVLCEFPTLKVKPVSKKREIKVDIDPDNPERGYWKFTVQRLSADGVTWTNWRSFKTANKKKVRYVNPKKGTYRVFMPVQNGYQSTTSGPVTLKK